MALTQSQTAAPAGAARDGLIDGRGHASEAIGEHRLMRRAIEAAIWGMPIVSVDAMRRAFFAAGAKYGDFVYCSKPADWKFQVTTPNASSLYVFFNFNTKDGPLVLDFPAADGAGLFGSILDAWQIPLADFGPEGEDRGKGAKYVILPPAFEGGVPDGAIAVWAETYNGYGLLRAIPASSSERDLVKALALVKRLRLYPLAQAASPPASKFIDTSDKLFDGIVRMDDTFFDSLAKMVKEEPAQMRDMAALGQLRAIGIEKSLPFTPNAAARGIFRDAAAEAQAEFIDSATRLIRYWPDAQWGFCSSVPIGAETGFGFQTENGLAVDERGTTYFMACAAPKQLGAATLYLTGAYDKAGAPLNGHDTYRLRVPANVPAKQFWAVTVYDLETAAFIRGAPHVEINSYHNMLRQPDGSVDVFFGPRAPAGKESNWIYTAPGREWICFFRFYGPERAIRDKSWRLPDIEKLA